MGYGTLMNPLVNVSITMENHRAIHGKTHEISMAIFTSYLCMFTRGYVSKKWMVSANEWPHKRGWCTNPKTGFFTQGMKRLNMGNVMVTNQKVVKFVLPSGKRLHSYGKSLSLIGKSPIYHIWAIFYSYVCLPEGKWTCMDEQLPFTEKTHASWGRAKDWHQRPLPTWASCKLTCRVLALNTAMECCQKDGKCCKPLLVGGNHRWVLTFPIQQMKW